MKELKLVKIGDQEITVKDEKGKDKAVTIKDGEQKIFTSMREVADMIASGQWGHIKITNPNAEKKKVEKEAKKSFESS